jgi:hypothetical protein
MDLMVEFFQRLFQSFPPLVFDFTRRKRGKLVIFTDASFSRSRAGLGICVFDRDSGERFVCDKLAPTWMLDAFESRKTQINQLELLAILCSVLTFGHLMQDREVLFFCDNTSALSACVHGYARSSDMGALANALHLSLATLGTTTFFEWCPSLCNCADLPSRLEGEEERGFYAKHNLVRWPTGMILPPATLVASASLDWAGWRPYCRT